MSLFQLHRIEVDHFQQFREPVVIDGLEPGLNVIAGENEAGKSTLLRALRAALFDRYRSSTADRFRPHGQAVSPRVVLDFSLDGRRYHLEKIFSKRKDGNLVLEADDGQRWEGPAAEDHLARLLGFEYPGRGPSKPEHQGLAGLLWVEQGSAHQPVVLGDEQRDQVQSVFEQEVRELLGGDGGEALFRRIQEKRDRYFDKRGKPRGDYRKLQQRAEELAAELEEKRAELENYESQVDQLGRIEQRLQAYHRERLVEQAEQKVRQQQEAASRIEALRARIAEGEAGVAQAQLTLERAQHDKAARQAEIEAVEEARKALEAADEQVARLEARVGPLQQKHDEKQAAVEELKSRAAALESDLRRARNLEELARLTDQHQTLAGQLDKARQLEQQRRKARTEAAALRVEDDDLARLEKLQRELDLGEERLNSVATRLVYELEPGVAVQLDGQPLSNAGERHLTREATLAIEGVGRLRIVPGGEDLQPLQEKLADLRKRLREQLQQLGAQTIEEARNQLNRRKQLENDADQAKAELKGVAPKGLQVLEEQVETLAARIEALRDQAGDAPAELPQAAEIEKEADQIRDALAHQEAKFNGLRDSLRELQFQLETARANRKEARRRLEAATQALEAARHSRSDQALEEELNKAAQTLTQKQQALETAQAALAAENPEAVESELERARRVLEDLKEERLKLQQEAMALRAALEALGQQGLAEQLADLETEYAQVQRQLEQETRQARALDLLATTLAASLQRARQAVARPIVERLVDYLRQLIPGAEPLVDDTLGLAGLRRNGVEESFETLSIGTREQLAVLVRLAYADLLAEAGVPVSVVLDDALVNSDDDRRDRMKAILYQAARRYQILVLTCHGREYRDAGGRFIRLEEG